MTLSNRPVASFGSTRGMRMRGSSVQCWIFLICSRFRRRGPYAPGPGLLTRSKHLADPGFTCGSCHSTMRGMRSTMQDVPLSIASIVRHGQQVFGDSSIVTLVDPATGDGNRRASFADVADNAARLAHGLKSLGINGDQRVGTFMWNNQEHMEAHLANPSMGAVLHTLNIRLFPEQVSYIANHGEDRIVIVDSSLIPLLARVLGEMESVRTVVVCGDGDTAPLEPAGKDIVRYADLLAGGSTSYDWPDVDERSAAAM